VRDPSLALLGRVAIVALVAGLIVAARPLLAGWRAARSRKALETTPLPEWRTGRPLVLLFTGTLCSDCLRQKDVLESMDSATNRITVREIFAAKAPQLAERFGVHSVPATVVLDGDGRPRAVNYGLVDAATLSRQLATTATTATA
jgi:thioredoxin-like negative regulator of GroEL